MNVLFISHQSCQANVDCPKPSAVNVFLISYPSQFLSLPFPFSFSLSTSFHSCSLHGFSLLPVFKKKTVPQIHSTLVFILLYFHLVILSFVFVNNFLSLFLFFPAFLLPLPPTDVMLQYVCLLCLCHMFSNCYLFNLAA